MTEESEPYEIVSKAQSHIIERPRLTKLLDETEAKIITLVAPAGYGKTTLARQWLKDKPTAWYRATPASADVAALAMGIAEAVSTLVPGAGEKLRQRLSSAQAPEIDSQRLSEMLARDVSKWPPNAWLVVDDYQIVHREPSATSFIDSLTALSPIQLLVTSRERPTWASSRRLLYGEVLEVGHALLALNDAEVRSVLELDNSTRSKRFLDCARGWPAVIGLAAMTNDFDLPDRPLPLYDFFADELYHAIPEDLRAALRRLAALPVLNERLATFALGEPADDVLKQGLRLGFLSWDQNGYELHPLLRQFLLDKLAEEQDDQKFIEATSRELMRLDRWDDVFTLIQQFGLYDQIHDLLAQGLAAILRAGRLTTVERWAEYARSVGVQSPLEHLAAAEIARRRGFPAQGEALALQAVTGLAESDAHSSRAYAVAGECAYMQTRFVEALEHYAKSEALARSPDDARRALWGRLIASIHMEQDVDDLLDRFRDLTDKDVGAQLRLASGQMFRSALKGHVSRTVDLWGRLMPLVTHADDPLARSSYCYQRGTLLMWSARYGDALPVLQTARAEAEANGFEFVIPHIAAAEAGARIGLRQFTRAAVVLDEARDRCRGRGDAFTERNVELAAIRLALARGRYDQALELYAGQSEDAPSASFRGESFAVGALTYAALERWEEASDLASKAISTTKEIEARTLGHLVQAIVAVATASNGEAEEAFERTGLILGETENFDSLVTAYRVFPWLLRHFRSVMRSSTLRDIVTHAHDETLGVKFGIIDKVKDQILGLPLSRREREVLKLLCQGLTNKEIGKRLFITDVTVKAHVRSIFAKLGVRSRTEAVLRVQAEE